MARVNALTHLFNTGEISKAALNRVDKDSIRLYAERQENLLPYTIGKAKMRPGMRYLGTTASETVRPRLLPFYKSSAAKAVLELTNQKLRVWHDDELVTREEVDASITNGDFSSATGWTETETGGASVSISGNQLTMSAPYRGGKASIVQEVTTNSVGTEHAVRIDVGRGPVNFKIGSTSGAEDYLSETSLDTGVHSLAFTPTGVAAIDSYTKLLLHFEGSDEGTVFTDSSSYANTVTCFNGAQTEADFFKFGSTSGEFDGFDAYAESTSSNYVIGSGDYTIEFFMRREGVQLAGTNHGIVDLRSSGDTNAPRFAINSSAELNVRIDGSDRFTTSALTNGQWYHVALTRSGGVHRFFLDGVLQGSYSSSTSYTSTDVTLGVFYNRKTDTPQEFQYNGQLDELRLSVGIARWTSSFSPPTSAYSVVGDDSSFFVEFSTKLDRDIIVNSIEIEDAGVMELTAPWTTDELRDISYDQSGDIVFLAHGSWQQRKIERRGNHSWSLVLYQADDGPFTTGRTSDARLRVGATTGNTTLTSDIPFFTSNHVGALFRITHQRTNIPYKLAGENIFTDPLQVQGVGTDNSFTITVTTDSTFSGTLSLQRSVDSENFGFTDLGNTYTSAGSSTFDPATEYDNIIQWFRAGFAPGSYTSGTAVVTLIYSGYGDSGICRVTGFTSSTQVSIEILSKFTNTHVSDDWQEGEWSNARGWPSAVGFFDGRLWWMGNDKFWGSESNNFYNFNLDTEGDSGSIQRTIATGGAFVEGRWILGLQRLIFGTDGAEISARSSSFDEPLTPTNITLKPASTHGSANATPARIDSKGLFIDSSRRKLLELSFSVDAQDYVATDLTRIHEDIADAINPDLYEDALVEVAVQRKPENYIWVLRDDGVACPVLYNFGEEVRGFNKVTTGRDNGLDSSRPVDRIVSVCPLRSEDEDDVYFAVERTIDDGAGGSTQVYYLEKMSKHSELLTRQYNSTTQETDVYNGTCLADSFITTTGTGAVGQVITGLDHLEGREVIFCGRALDGTYRPASETATVSGGQVTTPEGMIGTLCVGLPYAGWYKSSKLAYGSQKGTALTQKKRVETLGLVLLDTHPDAIRVGSEFADEDDMDELPRIRSDLSELDADAALERDLEEHQFPFPGEWSTDSRVCIYVRPGYSATLAALIVGIAGTE